MRTFKEILNNCKERPFEIYIEDGVAVLKFNNRDSKYAMAKITEIGEDFVVIYHAGLKWRYTVHIRQVRIEEID